jgi:multicomponent Na+:H+ antiporter subunit D
VASRELPFSTGYLPLMVLVGLSVIFGLFPEEVLKLAQLAAHQLLDPSAYIQSVFPGGGAG